MPDVSGARGRNDRARRSSAGANTTQGPTVRRHIQARETPEVGSSMAGSELGQVFSNFFGGLTSAANMAGDAARIGINAEIDRRNAVERQQGQADALFGKDADPVLVTDSDYIDTFQATKGARYGIELGQEMSLAASELNYDADIDSFKQEFLKNKVGGGTGTPAFDGEMMRQFEQSTMPVVQRFKQRALMETQRKAVEDTLSVFAANIASNRATPTEFASTIEHTTGLLGGDREEARKRAFATVVAASRTPEGVSNAISLITNGGFGSNGVQSFVDAFPEAGMQMMDNLIQARTQFGSVEALETYNELDVELTRVVESGDIEGLMALGGRIQQYGITNNASQYAATLQKGWLRAVGGISQDVSLMNQLARRSVGERQGTEDISGFKKIQAQYLEQTSGTSDWLNSEQSEEVVRGLAQQVGFQGFASDDVKHYISTAFSDPVRQVNAFKFLSELEHRNPEMVKDVLGADGFHQYRAVNYLRTLPNAGLQEVFDKLGTGGIKYGENSFNWRAAYTGAASTAEAQETALKTIIKGTGFFGGGSGMDAAFNLDSGRINMSGIRAEALESFELAASFYQSLGIPDATGKAARDVAVGLGQRYAALPGQDGTVHFLKADHLPADRVHLGTSVPNPNKFGPDGQPVMQNTIDTFYGDVKALGEKFPMLQQDSDETALVYDRDAAPRGGFALYAGGTPVMVNVDQPIDMSLPPSGREADDAAATRRALQASLAGGSAAEVAAALPAPPAPTKQSRVLTEAELQAALPPGWAMKERAPGSPWRTLIYIPRIADDDDDPTVAARAASFKPQAVNKLGLDQTGP